MALNAQELSKLNTIELLDNALEKGDINQQEYNSQLNKLLVDQANGNDNANGNAGASSWEQQVANLLVRTNRPPHFVSAEVLNDRAKKATILAVEYYSANGERVLMTDDASKNEELRKALFNNKGYLYAKLDNSTSVSVSEYNLPQNSLGQRVYPKVGDVVKVATLYQREVIEASKNATLGASENSPYAVLEFEGLNYAFVRVESVKRLLSIVSGANSIAIQANLTGLELAQFLLANS